MKIDRVKYTAHYDEYGQLKDQWIGMEAAIDDTEDAKRQLTAIKELTESWYKSNTPTSFGPAGITPYDGNYFPGPRIIEKTPEDREPGLTPELLMECKDIKALDIFYKLIIRLNREDLMEAYNKRKAELVAKESNEILQVPNNYYADPNESLDDNK